MQYQAGVEKAGQFVIGLLTVEHIEEVGCLAQSGIRRDGFFAVADAVPGRHHGGELGGQAHGLTRGAVDICTVDVGVISGHHGHGSLENVHGQGVLGHGLHGGNDFRRHLPLVGDLAPERIQLVAIGKGLEQEQVDHLLERGFSGQVLGKISPIDQLSLGTIDITDFRAGDGYPSESGVENRCTGIFHGSPLCFS